MERPIKWQFQRETDDGHGAQSDLRFTDSLALMVIYQFDVDIMESWKSGNRMEYK